MTLRPSVRLRLTLLYGGLFLLAGALLLVVNYGLVRSRLPPGPVRVDLREAPTPAHPVEGERFVVGPAEGVRPVDPVEARRLQAAFERGAREFERKTMQELLVQSGVALGLMAVVSVGLGWAVAGRVLRPLHRITGAARRLSEENLHERIALEGPDDELKELADTFDAMLARLDASFEAQRRFIANASHELRTPLAIQRTLVDVNRTPEELAAVADDLRDAIDRSERLIDALLLLARSERQVEGWEDVDVAKAVADAASAVAAEAEARGVRVEASVAPATARGDAALVERAVANLVENSVRHNLRGGWARVAAGSSDGTVRVTVTNTGPEIDPAQVPSLFEPFRRLAERTGSAEGAGLGLSIVHAIATAHGGEVRARPREGGGLEVELALPGAR